MSYRIVDVMAEYTDRQTGARAIMCEIAADTAADLPANTADLQYILGTFARTIDTGDLYKINSSGSWILQPSDNQFVNVYTKQEVDSIISDINSDIVDAENDISELHSGLSILINSGGKNRLQNVATSRTVNGITFTVNSDGTVIANGTATANAYIIISSVPTTNTIFDGTYILSGCPSGGVYLQTYALYGALSGYTKYDLGDGVILTPPGLTGNISFVVMVYNGYTADNIVFRPMICSNAEWKISHEFTPYCPTLPELYALVKSYHP